MPTGLQGSGKDGNSGSSKIPAYSPSFRAHHPLIAHSYSDPIVLLLPKNSATLSLLPWLVTSKSVAGSTFGSSLVTDLSSFSKRSRPLFVSRIWLRGRFLHNDRVTRDILVAHLHYANLYYGGSRGIFSGRTRIVEALAESIILAREEAVAEVERL
jgi:hypothetical protein